MSWTIASEELSAFAAPRALRARPLGSLAASMIGIAAIVVLTLALPFAGESAVKQAKSPPPPVTAAATAAAIATAFAPSVAMPAGAAGRPAAFALSAPEFAHAKNTYSVLRLEQGGDREDALVLGEFDGGGAYLRLHIHQAGGEKLMNSDFFLDMTRHAAQAGLAVMRIGQPSPLASRFGSFEAADIRLSHADAASSLSERDCLAVRLVDSKPSLEIAGLACGATGQPIDRPALTCILDRLEFASSGDNKAMEQFFLKAELERAQGRLACGGAPGAAKANPPDAHPHPPAAKRSRSTSAR
ncbi:MAG: hypothetical protein HYS06_12410 [Methylocystis sp.]|nr:hypothetical protein [Methylocystis sp.]MBI3275168.1 hypothetical protein [Methylocystis sp.]